MDLGAAAWGDYNGDQKLDIFLTGRTSSSPATYTFVLFENIDTLANQVPVQPLDPFTQIIGREVILSWDAPNNLPANIKSGLSYNLLLYQKGESVLLHPSQADSTTGYRRIVRQGSAGHSLSWKFRDLPDGNYAWRVQTVDQDFEGSLFTDPISFSFSSPIPRIIAQDFPELYVKDGTAVEAQITIDDPSIVDQVILHYKGIASADWNQVLLSGAGPGYSYSFDQTVVDEMGLEYVFEVIGTYDYDTFSDTGYTYLQYPNGFDMSLNQYGKKFTDYDIIAIPLELDNNQVASVIEEYGAYNNREWRLWNQPPSGLKEYTESDFSTFEPGNGYWLVRKKELGFNTGPGRVVEANDAHPYEIELKQGHNQIGTPFPFAISWNDILAANSQEVRDAIEEFFAYEGDYVISDRIKHLRGGFVFAHADVTLKIPVRKNNNVQRDGDPLLPSVFEDPTMEHWFLPITARLGNKSYQLGGLGMTPEALADRDPLDRMTPPRFGDFLELRFEHPDYFYTDFTREVVPSAKHQIWEFTVESSLDDPLLELNWNPGYLPVGPQQWILFDVDNQKAIDVTSVGSYKSLSSEKIRHFRLYFGDDAFVQTALQPDRVHVGQAYPNPAFEEVHIPFTLPPSSEPYQLRLTVMNALGQQVAVITEGVFDQGFHEAVWNGTDASGRSVAAGVYVYRLEVSGSDGTVQSAKLQWR